MSNLTDDGGGRSVLLSWVSEASDGGQRFRRAANDEELDLHAIRHENRCMLS